MTGKRDCDLISNVELPFQENSCLNKMTGKRDCDNTFYLSYYIFISFAKFKQNDRKTGLRPDNDKCSYICYQFKQNDRKTGLRQSYPSSTHQKSGTWCLNKMTGKRDCDPVPQIFQLCCSFLFKQNDRKTGLRPGRLVLSL